jgi:hypothetical protein
VATTATPTSDSGEFTVGFLGGAGAEFFSGTISDARLYNRPLAASEIQQLYAGGPGYGLRPERRRKYYFATSSTVIPRFVHHYRQQGAA